MSVKIVFPAGAGGGGGSTTIQTVDAGNVTSPPWGPIWQLGDPTTPGIAAIVADNSTSVTTNSTIQVTKPTGNGRSWALYGITAPATPYTITCLVAITPAVATLGAANPCFAGMFMRNSGNSLARMLYLLANPSWGIADANWNSQTSFNANNLLLQSGPFHAKVWLRMKDDGTNIITSFSHDGVNFTQIFSSGRAAFITNGPNQVGFGIDNENTGQNCYITLLGWKQS